MRKSLFLGTILGLIFSTPHVAAGDIQVAPQPGTVAPLLSVSQPLATFDKDDFLIRCSKEYPDLMQRITAADKDQKTWQILGLLIDHHARDPEQVNLWAYAHLCRVKMVLVHNSFPEQVTTQDQKHQFMVNLIDGMGRNVIPRINNENTKSHKWYRLLMGMLFKKYAFDVHAQNPERRARHLQNAYYEFDKALNLRSSKTGYYFIAGLILDDHFTPDGMTREEAEALAQDYLNKAAKQKPSDDYVRRRVVAYAPALESGARAPYMRDEKQDFSDHRATSDEVTIDEASESDSDSEPTDLARSATTQRTLRAAARSSLVNMIGLNWENFLTQTQREYIESHVNNHLEALVGDIGRTLDENQKIQLGRGREMQNNKLTMLVSAAVEFYKPRNAPAAKRARR